jgi:succinate-semialdehyde dehydrogenase / glutarate-semialdehyde dehydrogenase
MDANADVGPMIRERQLQIVESQVEDARARGARVLAGGKRLPELGVNFYAPTVLMDVSQTMRIMREETFGPVLPVMAFYDDDEAVRLANDSEYGLAASVWTRDSARGESIARRIHAGTVMVNDVISCFGISEAPHGGVKASGIGRTHGRFGLEEMVRVKYLDVDRMPGMKKVWWYGYGMSFCAPDGRIPGDAVCPKSARSRAGSAARRRRSEAKALVRGTPSGRPARSLGGQDSRPASA